MPVQITIIEHDKEIEAGAFYFIQVCGEFYEAYYDGKVWLTVDDYSGVKEGDTVEVRKVTGTPEHIFTLKPAKV